jgi:transcriptional regulator with XRE-family HTH domain
MLEHTLAGEAAAERLKARRNAALRGAHQRGVTVEELAARLGLSEGWVRQVLAGKKPAVEEAA